MALNIDIAPPVIQPVLPPALPPNKDMIIPFMGIAVATKKQIPIPVILGVIAVAFIVIYELFKNK